MTDPEGWIKYAFTPFGSLDYVEEQRNNNRTYYYYDAAMRLTKTKNAVLDYTRYYLDANGRVTKVGAGQYAGVDPTEYYYDEDKAQMTRVAYTAGGATHNAYYYYDRAARLTKLADWNNANPGLRYAYDDANRLTRFSDYVASHLDYTYDDRGRVITMNDYHGNSTTYAYDHLGQMIELIAPGSKQWTFFYNTLGQPTSVNLPYYASGADMRRHAYAYDGTNRLTKISRDAWVWPHVFWVTQNSFTYALDDAGNITTVTDEEGAYWSYEYDGRYRLTLAKRSNDDDQTQARFGYAYDTSDNLLTKELPFLDEFGDGTLTDEWTVSSGTYDISSGYLTKTSAGDGARWPRGWLDCLWHHPHRVIGLVMAGRAVAFALRAGREAGLGQGR